MTAKLRLQRLEREQEQSLQRDRAAFRDWLRQLTRDQRKLFLDFCVHDPSARGLLPAWPFEASLLELPLSDSRVKEWISSLREMMKTDEGSDNRTDCLVHSLWRKFLRDIA